MFAGSAAAAFRSRNAKVILTGPYHVRLGESAPVQRFNLECSSPPSSGRSTALLVVLNPQVLYPHQASTRQCLHWQAALCTISVVATQQPSSSASRSVAILNPLPTLNSGSVTQITPGTRFSADRTWNCHSCTTIAVTDRRRQHSQLRSYSSTELGAQLLRERLLDR